MDNECVAILLAAYNGEKYIAQQIDSIIAQSYEFWHLWIRADSSSDETERIISDYAERDSRIHILKNDGLRLGARLNFGALMLEVATHHDYNYIMFSDQDDVWNIDKVELSLSGIKQLTIDKGGQLPLLLHTDFQYTDEKLKPFSVNENVAAKLSLASNKLALIANDNYIFGCTMIMNQRLLKLSTPVPAEAENHDFWIALHAAAFGHIAYINKKTMSYRQHGNNVSGGLEYSSFSNRIKRVLNFDTYIKDKKKRTEQFRAFFFRQKSQFTIEQQGILKKYLYHSGKGGIRAVIFMINNGFKLRGPLQSLVYYISLILDRN